MSMPALKSPLMAIQAPSQSTPIFWMPLVMVLKEFSAPFPGYYLYYPQRRHASPALRAFIDHLRAKKRPATRAREVVRW